MTYDIIIIGAGPAGLGAGQKIISSGISPKILLVDKTVPWDRPIPCAEGVERRLLERSIDIDPSWIRLVISRMIFTAPNGMSVSYTEKEKGLIIDRAKMQRDLAERLQTAGVEMMLGKKVVHVSPMNNGVREAALDTGEKIKARVVIDASGPVAMLGKGENICYKPYNLEPAALVIAKNVRFDEDAVGIALGREVAPGGYAWVFPRGGGEANIGVVVGKGFAHGGGDFPKTPPQNPPPKPPQKKIQTLLDGFLSRHYPDAEIITRFAGTIPCGYSREPIALPGLIKCGDAANAVNPISRAGIAEAFFSGGLGAAAAVEMLGAQTEKQSKKICKDYEKNWFKKSGNIHHKLSKVKNSLVSIPDEDYNCAAEALQTIPSDMVSMAKIFGTSLGRFPRLVWALRHLM